MIPTAHHPAIVARVALVAYQDRDIRAPEDTIRAHLSDAGITGEPHRTRDPEYHAIWRRYVDAYCRTAVERSATEGLTCRTCGKHMARWGRRWTCSDSCERRALPLAA
jgi:hypothetical protein